MQKKKEKGMRKISNTILSSVGFKNGRLKEMNVLKPFWAGEKSQKLNCRHLVEGFSGEERIGAYSNVYNNWVLTACEKSLYQGLTEYCVIIFINKRNFPPFNIIVRA